MVQYPSTTGPGSEEDIRDFIVTPGTYGGIVVTAANPLITLPFEYLVGLRQLEVYVMDIADHEPYRLFSEEEYNIALNGTFIDVGADADTVGSAYFKEIDNTTVQIINAPTTLIDKIYVFTVPHTSLPGATTERIVVKNQLVDNAIELQGPGNGIIFTSPNGTRYYLGATDAGKLILKEE